MSLVLVAEGNPNARFTISGTLVIGRSRLSDLVLDSAEVSRVHCRLVRDSAGTTIEDMDSSHGTYVNDVRIRGRAPIKAGDRLTLGPYVFRLEEEASSTPDARILRGSSGPSSGAYILQVETVAAEEESRNPPAHVWRDSLRVGSSKAVFLLGELMGDAIPGLKSKLRSGLRRLANKHAGAPAQILAELNRSVHESGGRAVAICAMLDLPAKQLTYASAVFHAPWVVRATGRAAVGEISPALELGQIAAARFSERRVQLEPGDTVVLQNNEFSALVGRGDVEQGDRALRDTIGQLPADVPAVAARMRALLAQLQPFPGVTALCVGFKHNTAGEASQPAV